MANWPSQPCPIPGTLVHSDLSTVVVPVFSARCPRIYPRTPEHGCSVLTAGMVI